MTKATARHSVAGATGRHHCCARLLTNDQFFIGMHQDVPKASASIFSFGKKTLFRFRKIMHESRVNLFNIVENE